MWVGPNRPTYSNELCDIESAFAKLELRHESLPLPEAFPKFDLRDARVLSSLHEQVDHSLVKVGTK